MKPSHECVWFDQSEPQYFSILPFRQAQSPQYKIGRTRPLSRSYVLLATYGNEGVMARVRGTRKRVERAALAMSNKRRQSILIGRQISIDEAGSPIFQSVGHVLTGKADPLGSEQLESWILGLTRSLTGLAGPEAERLAARAVGILDFEYGLVDPKTLIRAFDQVQSVIANPSTRFMTAQQQSIAQSLQRVSNRTWRGTARLPRVREGLKTGFSLPDREVSRLLSRHHTFWVRDRYNQISGPMSERARKIVSRGVSDGLDRYQISRRLEKHFGEGLKQKGYWQVVAANHVTRARSYSMGSTMQAAGIAQYKIVAILDDRTTHQCLFLHNKILPVSAAVQNATSVMRSSDPEAVMKYQPFIRDKGDRLEIEYPGGKTARVADITSRSTGMSPYGPTASFARGMSNSDMVDASIGFPPYHHGCRTTIIAA